MLKLYFSGGHGEFRHGGRANGLTGKIIHPELCRKVDEMGFSFENVPKE